MKKSGNEVAIRDQAALAARAWAKLESAATETLNAQNGSTPSLRLFADTGGITAHVTDAHGTSVVIQHGKISMNVASQEAE
ncbi:MAG: hypothetical protein WCC90_07350 [Methylocella sp.]